jgi:gamma-glutamyltranspeptidase/glutathione hydrolase
MQEAVAAKRVHSQWLPDEIFAEAGALDAEAQKSLVNRGHIIHSEPVELGRVDAILIREDGQMEGGADPRGDDTAMGY